MMKIANAVLLSAILLTSVGFATPALAQVGITITSPADYVEGTLELSPATMPYIDRSYPYTAAPEFYLSLQTVRTANRDRWDESEDYLVFEVDRPVTVYLLYSSEAASAPNWVASTFTQNGDQISRNYHTWNVWQRDYPAGQVILGGNMAPGAVAIEGGSIAMFSVVVAEADEAPGNRPPAITSVPVTTATEGVLYTYDVEASDPDAGDVLTYSLDTAPSGMIIDGASGLIEWTPDASQVGDHAVTVRVEDGEPLADTQSYNVTVSPDTPVDDLVITITAPADYTEGTLEISPATRPYIDRSYVYIAAPGHYLGLPTVQTANRDRAETTTDYLHFEINKACIVYVLYSSEAASVPAWLSGSFTQNGDQVSRNYHTWNVWQRRYPVGEVVLGGNRAPGAEAIAGGALGMFSVVVEEALGPAAEFSATPRSGDLPLEVSFTDESDGNVTTWSWTFGDGEMSTEQNPVHSYAEAGSYTVTLEVSDADGSDTVTKTDYISVVDPALNQPPVISSTPVTTAEVDSAYSYDVEADDPNAGDTLTYSLDISPSGMVIDSVSGLISWTPTASQVGDHAVTVRVEDQEAAADTQSYTVTVTDDSTPVALEITILSPADYVEGTLDLHPASRPYVDRSYVFTAAPERYIGLPTVRTANADRGETSLDYLRFEVNKTVNVLVCYSTQAASVPDWLSSRFTQNGDQISRNYHDWNVWEARFAPGEIVLGGNSAPGASAVAGGTIAMFAVVVEESSGPAAAFSGTPRSGNLPLEVSFTDSSTGPVDSWSWTFGDGGMSTEQNPVHSYAAAGLYTVTLDVTGAEGSNTKTETDYIEVIDPNVNQAPEITSAPILSAVVDTLYSYDVDAEDPDAGDVLTYSLDTAPVGMVIDPASGLIEWTPDLSQVGDNDVVVRVEDQDLAADTQSFTISVSDGSEPLPLEITILTPADYAESELRLAPGASKTYIDRSYVFTAAPERFVGMAVIQTANRDRHESSENYLSFEVNQAVNVYVAYSTQAASAPDWLSASFTQIGEQVSRTYHSWNLWQARYGAGTIVLGGNEAPGYEAVSGGSIGMFVVLVEPAGGPAADFSATPLSGSTPLEVSFTDLSDGNISSWAWDFGDGGSSDLQNPTHTYSSEGSYTVTLSVDGADGADSLVRTDYIHATDPANNEAPTITSTPVTSAIVGELYTYDAEATDPNGDTLTWSLDTAPVGMNIDSVTGVIDWRPDAGQVGDHQVVVRVEDPLAAADTQSYTVTVSEASSSQELTITILTPADYLESTLEIDPATNPYMDRAYPFTAAGEHYIGLPVVQTANRDRYEDSEDYCTFEVNKPVWVYVLYSTEAETAPDWLELNFTKTNDQISRRYHTWNVWKRQYPAGVVTLGGNEAPGLVIQEGGSIGMFSVVLEELEVPFADFNAVPVAGAPPLAVAFEDRSTGGINSWLWTFGDGETSSEQNPVHTYNELGLYTVTLDVSGYAGSDSRTRTEYINVTNDEINESPQITSSPITQAIADELYSYDVEATDPNAGDLLEYSLDSSPSGMTIDSASGLIQWTPNSGQVGSHEIVVRVQDGGGLYDTQAYSILVDVARVPWMHAFWDHRQMLTIDNPCGEVQSGKPVRIDLDSTFDFSRVAADGHDLRATLDDEITEIPLWIEHWNADAQSATVWVRLPTLPADGTSIYFYSGYEEAQARVRAASVFDLYDGFETDPLGRVAAGERDNPGQWSRVGEASLIESGAPGSWDASGVRVTSVIWDEDELEYRAYYEGVSDSGDQRIGVAFSPDGERWTTWRDGYLLAPDAGSWDESGLYAPVVWREGPADYRMLYTGAGSSGRQIGLATSPDGLVWTKSVDNPVFNDPDWAHGDTNGGGVIRVDGEYLMWYATGGSGESGIAVSTDLVSWSPYQPAPIFPSGGLPQERSWSRVASQTFRHGSDYYVFVNASDESGAHGEVDLYRSSSPYFPDADRHFVRTVHVPGPEGEWDSSHSGPLMVVTTGIEALALHDGQLRAYYAGRSPAGIWSSGQLSEGDLDVALSDAAAATTSLGWVFSANAATTQLEARGGTKSVRLADADPALSEDAVATFAGQGEGRVAAWMRRSGASNGAFDLRLFDGNDFAASAGFGADGYFQFWNGSNFSTTIPWSSDEWYLVEIFFDTLMSTYDVTIFDANMVELGSYTDIGFELPVTSINKASLWTSEGLVEDVFFDDFRVEAFCGADPAGTLGIEEDQPPLEFALTLLDFPEGYYTSTVSLSPDNKYTYFDRSYIFEAAPPEYLGLPYIATAVRDDLADDEEWITFHVNRPVTVYVGYSNTQVAKAPNWINHHYQENGKEVSRTFWTWQVWEREFPAGRIVLGSNAAAGTVEGHITNYTVIIEERTKP